MKMSKIKFTCIQHSLFGNPKLKTKEIIIGIMFIIHPIFENLSIFPFSTIYKVLIIVCDETGNIAIMPVSINAAVILKNILAAYIPLNFPDTLLWN